MNKKIVSFVLAMVLSVGLGVSSLFAYEYTGGTKNAGSITIDPQNLAGLAGNIDKFTGEEKDIKGAETTTTRICAVFNYTAGIVTTAIDADRNITIYDQGRYRATLGYNDDGTYTITNFAIYGTDWDKIEGFAGATDGEKLKNFLLYMGVSESALQCYAKDEDGNFLAEDGKTILSEKDIAEGKAGKMVDVNWLDQAAKQLKKGINHSISINFTAQYGASVTYSVNGKQLETIAYDGSAIQTFHYNAAGTLETITQLTYEADTSDASNVERQTTTSDTKVGAGITTSGEEKDKDGNVTKSGMTKYTIDKDAEVKVTRTTVGGETTVTADVDATYEDNAGEKHHATITLSNVTIKDGKLKGKYNGQEFEFSVGTESNKETKKGKTTKRQESVKMNAVYNTIHCDEWGRQSYVTNSNGDVTARYSYSSNGSITSTWDAATNSMTYYTGGKAAFVMNDAGFITTRYFYHENGSLDGVMTYNYDADKTDGNNVVATSMTAYRWGNVVGSANLADIQPGQPSTFDELRAAVDYIKANPGAAIDSLKAGAELSSEDRKAIEGISFASVSEKDDEDEDSDSSTDAKYSDEEREKYNKIMSKNTSTFGNITSIALYESDLKNTALMNAFGINANDMANMLAASNGYSAVGNMALTIDVLDFGTDTINGEATNIGVTRRMSMGYHDHRTVMSTNRKSETVKNGIVGQQLKVTLTVMDHGGQKYQANCSPITLRAAENQVITNSTTVTNQYSADPVVTGTAVTDKAELQKIAEGLGGEGSTVSVGDDGVVTITDKDGNVSKVSIGDDGVISIQNPDGTTSRYVAVKDAKINMLDGSGALDMAEGEVMLIDIGDMDASTIKNGDNVMFMGDVGYTSTGNLAVTMNTTYGGGFKNFGNDASALGAAMDRIAYVSENHDAATADEQWIVTNSNINSEALKDFANAMSKKNGEPVTLKELEQAWEDLLKATAPIF